MSRVPPTQVRRAIIDPLWIPLACLLILVFSVVAVAASLVAPLSRHGRVRRAATLAVTYLVMDVKLTLSCLALWLRHPRPVRNPAKWRAAHTALLANALSGLMDQARLQFGYEVNLTGEPPAFRPGRPVIVLARHAGPGDSFTLVHLLSAVYHRTPRVVLKEVLQWDPALDLMVTRLKGYFLPSSSGAGDDRAASVARMAAELEPDDALLIFPEGANWTPRRHRRSVMRLMRAGQFRAARRVREETRVLPPRTAGTVAALAACPAADVLVLAHTGLDLLVNPRQMWQALPLRNRPMRIRPWLHPAESVPRERAEAEQWLIAQWSHVDEWITEQQQ